MSDTIEEGELPMIEDSVVIKKGEIDDTEYTVVGEIIDPEQDLLRQSADVSLSVSCRSVSLVP